MKVEICNNGYMKVIQKESFSDGESIYPSKEYFSQLVQQATTLIYCPLGNALSFTDGIAPNRLIARKFINNYRTDTVNERMLPCDSFSLV